MVLNFLNFYTVLQDLESFRACLLCGQKYRLVRTACCLGVLVCVCPVEVLDQ